MTTFARTTIILACWAAAQVAPAAASANAGGRSAAAIVEGLRGASGCPGWKALGRVEIDGTHVGDGLGGAYVESLDTGDGRWVTQWRSRDFHSADGYDGVLPWSQDFSGGSNAMNAPSAVATARTTAWMNARGWCEARSADRYRGTGAVISHGRTLDVVEARPAGGATIAIYVDRETHLIDRTISQLDENHEIVFYSDWRSVADTVFPFETRTVDPEDSDTEVDTVWSVRRAAPFVAQTFARPSTPHDVSLPAGVQSVSVPYVVENYKPLVDVKIDGKGPFPFVVDTGGHFILTAQTAARVAAIARGAASSTNEGNVAKVGFVKVARLQIGGVTIRDQVAEVNPYGFRKLERGPRPPKAGWLGLQFFERFSVTFDPTTHLMTMRPLSAPRPVPAGTKIPLVFDEDSPLAGCTVAGKSGTCMLDTGNASLTIVNDTWARRNGLAARFARGVDDGGRRVSRTTLSLGPFAMPAEPISYAAPGMDDFETFNLEAAILSESLLDGFVSTYDYARGGVWLRRVPGYEPRPYNRSGVVASKMRSGSFVIVKIIARSPAASADLRPKDLVLAIDGVPSAQFSGGDFASANAVAKPSISLLVARGATHRRVTLRLHDLLPLTRSIRRRRSSSAR